MKKTLSLYTFFLLLLYITGLGHLQAQSMLDYEELAQRPVAELFEIGNNYFKINNKDTAIGYYIILAGKYTPELNKSEKKLCAIACCSAGEIYYQKENYPKAFELYLQSIVICEENGFEELLPELYKGLGNIYGISKDTQPAIECYEKALELARKHKKTDTEIKLLINLTGEYSHANRIKEAKDHYRQMMKFVGKDSLVEYFGYLSKGMLLSNEEKYDSAIICHQELLKYISSKRLEAKYTSAVYAELAKLHEKLEHNDSALYYYQLNIRLAEDNHIMYMLVESLQALTRINKKKGEYGKARLYSEQYWTILDSMYNRNEFNKAKSSQLFYELDKNYLKIKSLGADQREKELQIKRQKRILAVSFTSVFIFLCFFIVVYTQKKKLHTAYKDLFNRNQEILKSEQWSKNRYLEYEEKLRKEQEANARFRENKDKNPEKDIKGTYATDKLTDEQKENILHKINEVIEDTNELYDSDFGLERLADLIGSNSCYISQVINSTYNKNFRTYINEFRIKEAQLRLLNSKEYGSYTIQAIAESVGYKSQANFIATFKKTTGITPSIYQKIAKEAGNIRD